MNDGSPHSGELNSPTPICPTRCRLHDLLELRLVNAFVRHGVTIPVIRATMDAARETLGFRTPAEMLS